MRNPIEKSESFVKNKYWNKEANEERMTINQ